MELNELEKYEEITSVSFDHEGAHLASTHELQGGASNGWNTALILKGEDVDEDLVKALEQIEVTMSMEEFLKKFFGMWYDDAELLTKILGFETEEEYANRLEADGMQAPDRWGTNESWEEYKKRNLETRADKVKFVQSAQEKGVESLTTVEKIAVLEFQSELEKAVSYLGGYDAVVEKFGITNESDPIGDLSDGAKVEKSEIPAEGKSEENPSADNNVKENINKEVEQMTDKTDKKVEKSAEAVALEKMQAQMADLEKALEDAKTEAVDKAAKLESLEKAEEARKVAGAEVLVKSFGFIAEDKQEEVVDFMVKSTEAPLVAELLKQASEAIKVAEAKNEELKKEFGEEEHGVEGEDKVVSEQEALDKSLESFEETLKALAV